MKIKRIICILLAFQFAVQAQESKKKPSWTDAMPEREETPGIEVQLEKEEDFGLDRSSLGFDRDELSDTEKANQRPSSQGMTNKIEIQKQLDEERKKNAAQLAKIKKLEAEKLEAERLVAEKLAQEKRAEEEKIAAQKLAEQKKNQEQIAAQKKIEQNNIEQEVSPNEVSKQQPQPKLTPASSYKWKKIKNVAPVYPAKAARKKTEGWVDVEITIDSSGKVTGARVIKAKRNTHVFDNSALKAVKQWKYDPPSKYGIETELRKTIRMIYQL